MSGEPGTQGEPEDRRPAPASEPSASEERERRVRTVQRRFERMLTLSRLLVLIPVVFLLIDAAGSFVYGTDILLRTATGVLGEPTKIGGRLGLFLIVMDTFLVGATLMIAAFGFYELFIIRSERAGHRFWLPGWLKMHDLEDLKARVVSMLILVAAITFVDRAVESHDKQEVLFLGLGISIIIAALTAFLWFGRRNAPATAAGPGTTSAPGPSQAADATRPADSPALASSGRARPARSASDQGVSGPAGPARDLSAGASHRRARVLALLGSSRREGGWSAAPVTDVIAIAGWARLDLGDAVPSGERIRIRVVCALGLVSIAVPPEMPVSDFGVTLLGSRSVRGSTASAQPGAAGLVLSGTCLLGAVRVRRRP